VSVTEIEIEIRYYSSVNPTTVDDWISLIATLNAISNAI
jgi:hypothetical protein